MVLSLRPAIAGLFLAGAVLGAAPAMADVFSSQDFSGDTATLDQLPGVNLDVAPGYGGGFSNCAEDDRPSFTGRSLTPQKSTTCRVGNFSITSTSPSSSSQLYDTTYGGNPPPWVPSWKP
ncbi:MAG: hypothetical protein M9945_09785 [Aquamicrobium sp.]|uniref:hypothetical protein n=1 Tax=Aquamicrobium sp. TaxID=1872579 RepID=UPI00349EF4EF|nr:hypothetical protein [Aquamicrobium sp.]